MALLLQSAGTGEGAWPGAGNGTVVVCLLETTTTTTTATASLTTAANTTRSSTVMSKTSKIRCWSCGSLFSTESNHCQAFNSQDPTQLKTCGEGEACLYYTWRKSSSEKSSVIRECFPTSILLGSLESPVQPQAQCEPESQEEDTISTCLCTDDLCNGIGDDDIKTEPELVTTRLPELVSTRRPKLVTTSGPKQVTTKRPKEVQSGGVKCHQCGSLFPEASSTLDCVSLDPSDPQQQGECGAGEVCLCTVLYCTALYCTVL